MSAADREWEGILNGVDGDTTGERLGRLIQQRQIYADRIQSIDDLGAELVIGRPELGDQWAEALGIREGAVLDEAEDRHPDAPASFVRP